MNSSCLILKLKIFFLFQGTAFAKARAFTEKGKVTESNEVPCTKWHLKTRFILVLLIQQFSSENLIQMQRSSTWKCSRHEDFTTLWQMLIWQMGKLIKQQARLFTSFWTIFCSFDTRKRPKSSSISLPLRIHVSLRSLQMTKLTST